MYTVQWFSPITGVSNAGTTITIVNGTYVIGDKPTIQDWVLLMKKK